MLLNRFKSLFAGVLPTVVWWPSSPEGKAWNPEIIIMAVRAQQLGESGVMLPQEIAPETIFLPKISVKFLVRGMVGVCRYAPAAIIYLTPLHTCKGVKQLVLSVCQTCACNQTNRVSGVDSKSPWGAYPGIMSDTPQIMHLHNWHSNYSWAQLLDISTPAGCQHFIVI